MDAKEIIKEVKELKPAIKAIDTSEVAKTLVTTFAKGIDLGIELEQQKRKEEQNDQTGG